MRILGVDLARRARGESDLEHTVVLLDSQGRAATVERLPSLLAVATEVSRLTVGEPFLLGVDTPVVVPDGPAKARPVESLVRRRLGQRLAAGGRASLGGETGGVAGEKLLAALAAAGRPCLPYPDRNRRQPCLAEIHPSLILKALLWEKSALSAAGNPAARDELFRAYGAPPYRAADLGARVGWAQQAVSLDLLLGGLRDAAGFDLRPAHDALLAAASRRDVERAAGLLDASLIAGTARRYLESTESCLFLGDHQTGYVILPAGEFVRRFALSGAAAPRDRLFPQASLRERLGPHAQLRSVDLLRVPGRPQRTEADFTVNPCYEFDNLDEMLWWKHCRHVDGPALPTEGLCELLVALGSESELPAAAPLKLQRSRHRTMSFRFEPPASWRARVPTRDGKTYPFRILRATYETAPSAG